MRRAETAALLFSSFLKKTPQTGFKADWSQNGNPAHRPGPSPTLLQRFNPEGKTSRYLNQIFSGNLICITILALCMEKKN
ncbi:MAG TPA: hypothetical protein ENJ20_03720 [Bacteroidetes bacterium]|nr:hypothetical protein [Bacteroidota bacterium]